MDNNVFAKFDEIPSWPVQDSKEKPKCCRRKYGQTDMNTVYPRPPQKTQRTTGPVSLTRVLRICWIRTNLEIQEHAMLYKFSPIQKHQEQIWPCHKNGQGHPRVIIWKKPQGMGIQPLGTSSGSILKLSLFPWFWKISFASLVYMIFFFHFIHVYKAPGQEKTTLGDKFFMQAERSYHFGHWLHVLKNIYTLWFYAHFFSWFYICT